MSPHLPTCDPSKEPAKGELIELRRWIRKPDGRRAEVLAVWHYAGGLVRVKVRLEAIAGDENPDRTLWVSLGQVRRLVPLSPARANGAPRKERRP